MGRKVNVIGVGMVKFAKPGAERGLPRDGDARPREAALADAKVAVRPTSQQAYAGYVYGDSTCGQRAVYELGLTGIPVFNVNNNCSTGSHRAHARRAGGRRAGSPSACSSSASSRWRRARSAAKCDRSREPARQARQRDERGAGLQPGAARRADVRRRRPRVPLEVRHEEARRSRKISEKARKHAAKNPYALFNELLSLEEILASPEVFDPLTRYQCCPPTCGAAAAVLCSRRLREEARHRRSRSTSPRRR